MRVYEDHEEVDIVAAGYVDKHNDNRNSGYRSSGYHDSGKTTQVWQRHTRDDAPGTSIQEKMSGPCNIHFYIDKHDGKKKSSHLLKDYREFLKLHEGLAQMNLDVINRGYGAAPGAMAHGSPPPPPGPPPNADAPDQHHGGKPYPRAMGTMMIQKGRPSNRVQKAITRQVNLATNSPPSTTEYLSGSESCITFDKRDHPRQVPRPGHCPLIL